MRTFPVALAADLARRNGAAPVWLLRFTASGVDYILCQDAVTITPWSKTALPWIASWGQLTEGVSSTLADFNVSSLDVDLINDPAAAPNLRTLAKSGALTGVAVSVYLWVDGCTDAPFEMFRFRITEIDLPDEATVNVSLQDVSATHENLYPGTVVTRVSYPNVDPDDINKILPIVFGTVEKIPALNVVAGILANLSADAAATGALTVSDSAGISSGMTFYIDEEQIYVTSVSGNTVSATRGTNSTEAVTHTAGTAVVQKLTSPLVYLCAGHTLTSISKVWARFGDVFVDVTSKCLRYPSGPSGHSGNAGFTVSQYTTIKKDADLAAATATNTLTGSHSHAAVASTMLVDLNYATHLSGQPWTSLEYAADGSNATNGAVVFYTGVSYSGVQSVLNMGTSSLSPPTNTLPTRMRFHAICGYTKETYSGSGTLTLYVNGAASGPQYMPLVAGGQEVISDWMNAATWSVVTSAYVRVSCAPSSTRLEYRIYGVWWEIEYASSSTAAPAAGVASTSATTLSGNSVADTLVGSSLYVDAVSPITAPQDVITKILGTTCNKIGTFPAGYAFNGAITSSRRAPEWCHELARQCRAYFKWVLGQPTLIVRPDTLAPVKAINEIRLSNGMMIHGQRQTDINDVINTINLRYDRDWSSTSSGDEAYQQVSAGTNAASITTYGVRERPELFRFDFVTSPTMAANLAAFYLSWYAWQRWQHTQECYLFEAALEFGDAVTLAYLEGEIGECTEVGFSPGNGTSIDKIQLTIIE